MGVVLKLGTTTISSSGSSIDTTKIDNHINDINLHLSALDKQNLEKIKCNKGIFASETDLKNAYPTSNVGDYCVCFNGTKYTMWTFDGVDWIDTGVNGAVTTVNGQTGDITLMATDIEYNNGTNVKDELDKKVNESDITFANSADILALF